MNKELIIAKAKNKIATFGIKNEMEQATNIITANKVYEDFLENRQIIFNDEVNENIIETVVAPILKFNAEDNGREMMEKGFNRDESPIILYINSPGGHVTDGLAVVSAIESSRTPIVTIALGMACSMGFTILCAGHARLAQKYSTIMYHQISGMRWGKMEDHKQDMKYMEQLQKHIDEIVTSHTKIKQKTLDKWNASKQDWYMTSEEAKKFGVVDELLL